MRNLVTIRKIKELAIIDGWQCVTQKGNFKVGDPCVYFEIDSFLPISQERFAFLEPRAITFNGVKGGRIRTMKLRGALSQGLVLPLDYDIFPEFREPVDAPRDEDGNIDLASLINVSKWEPPAVFTLAGQVKGNFPWFIRKTDQERIQNIYDGIMTRDTNEIYEITEKMDGTSCTIYLKDGVFGVCSRNLELRCDEEAEGRKNIGWKLAKDLDLEEKLRTANLNIAIQGEICGPGIQANHLGLSKVELYVFDIFDIETQTYYTSTLRDSLCSEYLDILHVPILEWRPFNFSTIEEALEYAEDKSALNTKVMREGIVWKSVFEPNFSFKIINNQYLLKHGD